MGRKGWPVEVNVFLVNNVVGRTTKQLTELINLQGFDEKYAMIFTEPMIKTAKNRLKLKSGTKPGHPVGYSPKYPEGMEDFIRSIAPGRSSEDIASLVSAHFGIEFTVRQCAAYKKNHHINTGLTGRFEKGRVPSNKGIKGFCAPGCEKGWFPKGHIPKNHRPVGSERISKDGYIEVKVAEPGTWKGRHRIVWEEHNGPVPKGNVVMFLDGDPLNCNIENLACVDQNTNARLNQKGLRFQDRESTLAGINVAKLVNQIAKTKKNRSKVNQERREL